MTKKTDAVTAEDIKKAKKGDKLAEEKTSVSESGAVIVEIKKEVHKI